MKQHYKLLKLTLALCLICCFQQKATAQSGYLISDTAFAHAIRGIVPSAMVGDYLDTTNASLNNISRIDFVNLGIRSVDGVKYFRNLIGLYLSNNQISGILELPTGLENLSLPNNNLASISSLPANLNSLDVSYNPIAYIPELPSTLLTLYANNTNISVLPTLPNALFQLNVLGSGINCIQNTPSGPFPGWRIEGFQTDVPIGLCNPPCTTPAAPTITASGLISFNTGSSVTLTSSAVSGNLWSTGETSQSISVQSSGRYTVRTVAGTCTSAVSTATTVTVNTVVTQTSFFIPDPAFAEALRNIIPSAMNGQYLDTSNAAVRELTTLNVNNMNINSLEGVYYFPNLFRILAADNNLQGIPTLPQSLRTLSVQNNHIFNVTGLPNGIQSLDLSGNDVLTSVLDLPNKLEFLYVNGTPLPQLPTLPSGLYRLNSEGSRISCLPNIPTGPFQPWVTTGFQSDMNLSTCEVGPANGFLIVDVAFAAYLQRVSPTCMIGDYLDTTCAANSNLSVMAISDLGITNINGFQYFRNLNSLVADNNNIAVLPWLPNQVQNISINGNPVACLPNIPAGPFANSGSFTSSLGTTLCTDGSGSGAGTVTSGFANIPDDAFAAYLRSVAPSCMNGNLMDTSCIALTSIEADGLGINSLEGIQYIRTLKKLLAANNNLTDLPRIPANLESLSLQNNNITFLNISGGNSLRSLDLSGNPLSSVNTWPSTLHALYLGNTSMTSIPNLPNSLYYLNIQGAYITCLPNIPTGPFPSWYTGGFTNDRNLTLCTDIANDRFLIPDANFAAYLRTLVPTCMTGDYLDTTCIDLNTITIISAQNRNLNSLSGLKYFRNLEELDVRYNNLSELPTLPYSLWNLQALNNNITCIPNVPIGPFLNGHVFTTDISTVCGQSTTSGLYLIRDANFASFLHSIVPTCMSGNYLDTTCAALSSITTLDCQGRFIASIDGIVYFRNLTSLYTGGNLLTSLPLRMPVNISSLSISKNAFVVFPTIPNSVLSLDISGNNIVAIPSGLPSGLQTLYIEGTRELAYIYQLPNTLYNLGNTNSALACLPNIPTGPFPSWWRNGFTMSQTLSVCGVVCNVSTPTISASRSLNICAGTESVVLTASGGTSYLWNSGATSSTITVSTSGTYSVLSISGTCTSASSTPVSVTAATCTPTNSVRIGATFAAWLRSNSAYAPAMNGDFMDTTNNNVISTTILTMNGVGLIDLNGVQYFANLQTLIARDNLLTSIPILPATLKELTLRNNLIAVITSLPDGLESLDLSQNPVAVLPAFPTSLRALYLNSNPNLTAIPTLPNGVYYLECTNSVYSCVPNIPTGPFPTWWSNGYTNPQNLPACIAGGRTGSTTSATATVSTTVNLYPNPAHDMIYVSGLSGNNIDLRITSITGTQIGTTMNTSSQSIELPIQHLSSGIYFLNVNGKAFRFIKD